MHGSARRTLPGGHRPSPPPLKRKRAPALAYHVCLSLYSSVALFPFCRFFTRHPAPALVFPCARLSTETSARLAWRRKEREISAFRRRAHALWLTCQRSYTYSRAGTIPGLLSHARQQPDLYLAPRDHIRQPALGTLTRRTHRPWIIPWRSHTKEPFVPLIVPQDYSLLLDFARTPLALLFRGFCLAYISRRPHSTFWILLAGHSILSFPDRREFLLFFYFYLHASVSFPGRFRPVGLDITDSLAPASLHT